MIQNNVVMVGLTILVPFQQFEDIKFIIFFPREHAPGPPNSCRVSNRPDLGGIVPTLLEPQSGHEYSDLEDQLS